MSVVVGTAILSLLLSSSRSPGKPSATPKKGSGFVEEQLEAPLFGKVKGYRPDPIQKTRGVVLFISGDGGWNFGVVDMARRVASQALVVGLSMNAWRKVAEKSSATCWYPAGELESIAQTLEKRYGFPRYVPPILVGYSSGATLAYGILAQAPPEAFAGAVSLGFCPDLEVARPFCGRGDWKPTYDTKKHKSWLPPRARLTPRPDGGARWIVLHGQVDKVCDPEEVTRFAAEVPAGRLVPLAKVGHGFSIPRNWGAAYDEAVLSMLEPVSAWEPLPQQARADTECSPAEIAARLDALDLPLEVEWPEGARSAVVFVSGDGGWAEIDQEVAKGLTRHGIAVVGWNALRYFWQAKTPEVFRADLARVVEALPEEVAVFAGGYSFGAEVVPVALAEQAPGRTPSLSRLEGLVLLGPGPYASFEVSPLDWIRTSGAPTAHSVRKAVEALAGRPVLCVEPSEAADSGCRAEKVAGLTRVKLPGGHHFGGDFDSLAETIADFLEKTVSGTVSGRSGSKETVPDTTSHPTSHP